jgi:glycosyltransferase involved in cell wall biosynthesis
MRAMDVLAHPSYREGLPRTVPQALLAGVCPVAYDADGTREACIDGRTGLLVPVGDHAALGAAIRRAYEQPEQRAEMAARGRAWCAEAFSAQKMVSDLEVVYRRAAQLAGQRA